MRRKARKARRRNNDTRSAKKRQAQAQKGKGEMNFRTIGKTIVIGTITLSSATLGAFFGHSSTVTPTYATACPTLYGVEGVDQRTNCHFVWPKGVWFKLSDVPVDFGPAYIDYFDLEQGIAIYGYDGSDAVHTNEASLKHKPGSSNTANVTPTNTTPAQQTNPAPTATNGNTPPADWDPGQWNVCPAVNARDHAAFLFEGDAGRWQRWTQPEPGNFPRTWVGIFTEDQTWIWNPGFASVEYADGSGPKVSTSKGWVLVFKQVTVKLNCGN